LKKSWHPSTLKNIERVWKAEQKHEAEQKKIEQLQKELAEERTRQEMRQYAEDKGVVRKKQERLDWMYNGPASLVNREDYLTGRPMDKTFELAQQQENNTFGNNEDNVPNSLFGSASESVVVDLANKIREDPLFVIRKQEEENKKQLLNNPVRMKQLQLLLKEQIGNKKNKKDKRSKERSRKHRRHHRESSRRGKEEKGSTSESDSSEGSYVHHRSSRKSSHKPRTVTVRTDSDSDGGKYSRSNTYGLIETKKLLDSTNGEKKRKQRTPEKIKVERNDSRSRSPSLKPRRKLMPKEMEEKRQQMLNNAKWREEQRNKNMQKYKKEENYENQLEEQSRSSGALFLKPILTSAASNASVESRVKSNIYNIQRGRSDMDSNFARR